MCYLKIINTVLKSNNIKHPEAKLPETLEYGIKMLDGQAFLNF